MELKRPVVVKRVPARLDSSNVRALFRELHPFLSPDCPQLVFDCSSIEHMDSAGVEMLIDCLSMCIERDGDLKLASLSSHSATVLELTRTDQLFDIYETSTEALRSFHGVFPDRVSTPQSIAA